MKKIIAIIVLIILYLVALVGCTTMRNYSEPLVSSARTPTFKDNRGYVIITKDNKCVTWGKGIRWSDDEIYCYDSPSREGRYIKTSDVLEIKEKRFSPGKTLLLASGVAIVSYILIMCAGLKALAEAQE
jgi:hypothetical protein